MAARRPVNPTVLFARWRALLEAHTRAQAAARAGTTAAIGRAWARLGDPYDPAEEAEFARAAAGAVVRGRAVANDRVDAHMRRLLATVDVGSRTRPRPVPDPRGVPVEDVMARAVRQFRWEVSQGRSREDAGEAARTRAALIAETDLAMAARDAFRQVSESVPEIVGYRRVLHPELSAGGTCGLCIAAATRIYQKSDLMPLHNRCHCTQLPVVDGVPDLAQTINGTDLMDLYRRIGETQRGKLARQRVRVEEHGETGPTLIDATHRFRDREEAAADARPQTPVGDSLDAVA